MAQSYRSKFLAVMRANERRMTALFGELATSIAGELARQADANGNIPRAALPGLQASVAARVNSFFLGVGRNGERAPFDMLPNGVVIPLSPYMRALWQAIGDGMRVSVERQAHILDAKLPANIAAAMRGATRDPFAAARARVGEQVFRPNPLATYDAPHRWVDPNGYRLSDRVWNVAGDTRRRLDAFLEESVRQGRGARAIARELEQFLAPGRSLTRTKAPYGTDASYDAMRLARTEIARAHAQATAASAAMNPFVGGLKWNLSGSHPRPDICDDNARGGENGDGVYPLDGAPVLPAHPSCLCHFTQVMRPAAEQEVVMDELRAELRSARAEFIGLVGPLMADQFLQMLLGRELSVTRAAAQAVTA